MGFLDRLFGRRRSGSGGQWTRDDSSQYVQPPPTDYSQGAGEPHHGDHADTQQDPGQQDPGQQDPGAQDAQGDWDVQGSLEPAGGDAGGGDAGGGDSGGGGDGGGGGNGGGGGD